MLFHEIESIDDLRAHIDLAAGSRCLLASRSRWFLSQLNFNSVVLARQEVTQVGLSLRECRLLDIHRRERSEGARGDLKLIQCWGLGCRSERLLSLLLDQVINSLEVWIPLNYLPQTFPLLLLAKYEHLVGLRVNERVAIWLLLSVMKPYAVIYA